MRYKKQSAQEILQAEKAVDDRKRSRANGYSLMRERDRGWAHLHPYFGTAREVIMSWGESDNHTLFKLEVRRYSGKDTVEIILDAEELRKWLRWV